MATLADLVNDVEAAFDALPGGSRARMSQDHGDETTEFSALGQTRYQIQSTYREVTNADSAVPRFVADVIVVVHHALPRIGDEQAYTAGQMESDQRALLEPGFWRGLASVFEVDPSFPAIQDTPARTGKRVTYSIGARVDLN